MWYEKQYCKKVLDYSKPIVAKCGLQSYLLVGNRKGNTFCFDWLNINTGAWNSGVGWIKPEDAVSAYVKEYDVHNVKIKAEPL